MDAIARILGAIAATASAVAAFLALQNYTRLPQVSPTTPFQPNTQQPPNIAPQNTAPQLNPNTQRSPAKSNTAPQSVAPSVKPNVQRSPAKSTVPATPWQNNDDDDDDDGDDN